MRRKLWGRLIVREEWVAPMIYVGLIVLSIALALAIPYLLSRGKEPPRREAQLPPTGEPHAAEPPPRRVLESPLAGRWYDADRMRLAAEIDGYLAKVEEAPLDDAMALILPHAGYRYSGQTAAYGVKQVSGHRFDRVIVMGPSHRLPMENMASVPDVSHYGTPLGEVELDWQFIAHLKQYPQFHTVQEAHTGEHSVQIEVPLLQHVLGDFRLVPIVVGDVDAETTREMADILSSLIDEHTLVVVSSDFTHYGADYRYVPFRDNVADNLEKLDMDAFAAIERKDAAAFRAYYEETGATVCGRCPIGILLAMLPEEAKAHLLKYDTSGRMTGDYERSVSYLSIAFTGRWEKGGPVAMEAAQPAPLTEEDKRALLKLARGTLEYVMEHRSVPAPEDVGVTITPAMENVMGAFVTLHERGQLRGCIGEIFPRRPLYKAVMEQAVNAALNDRRFPQVQPSELPELEFEISALTPPHPVASSGDIVLGEHGVVLEKNGRRAVFLPQVAPEQGWDLDETLTHLSQKAGLPPDAWKEDALFTVFEAVVFAEEST